MGLSRDSTWKNLLAGVSGIDHIDAFNPEDLETTIAGEVKGFEPTDYMSRKDSKRMDRFSQLAVAAAGEAVEQAEFATSTGMASGSRSWWRAVSGGSSRCRSRLA